MNDIRLTILAILMAAVIGCEQKAVDTAPDRSSSDPLTITAPGDGAGVNHRLIVRGRVDQPKARVHVIVRPMATASYWVQPPVDTDASGDWSVQVYIGRSENENNGERFKIMAVADPEQPLTEGDVLSTWPKARLQSRMIEVVKQ